MLCLLVGLISRRCAMARAAAQTSPELEFRKMNMLRDLATFGHLLAIPGDWGIEGCKWPSPLDSWEMTAMPEQQCVPSHRQAPHQPHAAQPLFISALRAVPVPVSLHATSFWVYLVNPQLSREIIFLIYHQAPCSFPEGNSVQLN